MKLHIKNFRSIKELDMEIAPITVLYGHNGTGKSSILYAPLTLKNIVLNPDPDVSGFFDYKFASLGGFKEVIFDHSSDLEMELGVSLNRNGDSWRYHVALKGKSVSFRLKTPALGGIEFRFPPADSPQAYGLTDEEIAEIENPFSITWNGVTVDVTVPEHSRQSEQKMQSLRDTLNYPMNTLKKLSFVPLARGFFRPVYSLKSVSPMAVTEAEVTSLLATDKHLEYSVSRYMEQMLGKDFRVRGQIGSGSFSLDSIDRRSGVGVELVNEGFGVNQLVYMMTKVLRQDTGIVCIEEPEIHLHPTAIRQLARTLVEIVRNNDKRLIISTHSEQFVLSLMAMVVEGACSPDDIAAYLVTKDGKSTRVERQEVNDKGQIQGGLSNFMEGELEDMKTFLGVG